MCKSAHQSFSHRVKSVTMSTWTLKEVRALSEKHGGGNKACIAKWLSSGDVEKYRPHPGDSLDKYKNFIRLAYEEKMFMAKPDEGEAAEEPAEEPVEEKAAEQDVPVGPMPAEEVQEQDVPAAEEIPEAVSEPAAIETAESAALDEEIPAAEESVPYAVHQTTFSHAAVPATMNRLIIDAMIASVVIVIMFTVATAIRSAYKMPLSYLLSAVIAILISFLPFVICIIIGGMSKVWWSYFLLLLSFFIFRSGRGRRDSR